MADDNNSGGGSGSSSNASRSRGGSSRSRRKRIDGREAVVQAREQLAQFIGRPVEGVMGLSRRDDDDDGWRVTVQVVELSRIPSSTDVLGSYEVDLDGGGDVVGLRRTRRFYRSQADGG